jgi:hypothetical protein
MGILERTEKDAGMAPHLSDETLREILRREWCRGFDEGLKHDLDEGRRVAIDRRHINRAKRELAAAAMQPANRHAVPQTHNGVARENHPVELNV